MGGILSAESKKGTDGLSELPDDVLRTIVGFFDLPTLCTARLVCKRFSKYAAEHFKSLDCKTLEELPTTDLTQFSGTTHLAVTFPHESHLQSLAHPWIAPVVTHISLTASHLRDSQSAEELEAALLCLLKLRSVTLHPLGGALFLHPPGGTLHLPLYPGGNLHLPLFPPTLEELRITDGHDLYHLQWGDLHHYHEATAGVGDASSLTRYSQLRSLAIDLMVGAGPSMGSLSSLRELRSLDLHSCPSALAPLSTFTALTGLTFREKRSWGPDFPIFEDLGRLTGLSQLVLMWIQTPKIVEHGDLTCIAQLTNLTCLDMSGCRLHRSAHLSTALAPLTRLVAVSFSGRNAGALVSSLRVSTLHSLALWGISDISLLQRAARLSEPDLHCRIPMYCSSLRGGGVQQPLGYRGCAP